MTLHACREASASPAATRRMLLAAIVLAAAMLADAWSSKQGSPMGGTAAELLALAVAATVLAPVSRVGQLPWITAGLVGAAMLGERLAGLTPAPTGVTALAMMLSATAPSMAVGLAAAGMLAAAELVAAII